MSTPTYLRQSSLTAALNEMKVPLGFIQRLLFARDVRTLATEDVELSVWERDRKVAPFIRRGAPGQMIEGYTHRFDTVTTPYMRLKVPVNPWEKLQERQPGQGIFTSAAELRAKHRAHIARMLAAMEDDIQNRIEWMCAQALQGEISYSVADEENFVVTFPKPSGHTLNVAASWATSTTDPSVDFKTAKRLLATAHARALPLTHCILSPEASDDFMALEPVRKALDQRNVEMGRITFEEQFSPDGSVIYLGRYCGVDVVEYAGALDGSNLIRANYAEFVSAVPQAENKMFYGCIPDEDAPDGLFVGRRFSKSWVEKDPSARMLLAASRPLPVMERPGSVVSMHTTAGL